MFHALPPPLNSIVAFVIVLGVLVFVHELGHYLAARWMGVHVEAFSIGFGRPLARWTDRRGTEWRLSILPLGGYVKLHGQERPEDVAADVRAAWQPGRTFHEKQVWRRAIVIAAGPVANFLLAAVLFAGLFATQGDPIPKPDPIVGEIVPDSAAAHAGLRPGDVIEQVDGVPVTSFVGIPALVQPHPATALTLLVRRGASELSVPVVTDKGTETGHVVGTLGITASFAFVPVSPGEAVRQGVIETWDRSGQILTGVWQMISGQVGTGQIGGVLRIAQISGQSAAGGLGSFVTFIAALSVNLGLINLFPIPVLDGGHLMFFVAEALRGRPLPPRAIEYGFRAGLALIAALFVFAAWNDLTHLGLMRWVAGLVGSS